MSLLLLLAFTTLVTGNVDVIVSIDGVVSSFSQSQMDASLSVSNMSVISYNDQNVTLAQAVCPTGSYCPSDSTSSIGCPAGSFQPLVGMTQIADCQQCPVNTYCPHASSVAFTPCPSGFLCNATGMLTPIGCAVTTYQPLSNQSACLACTAGSKCPLANMSTAMGCGLGSYQPLPGQTACSTCPAGQYCALDATVEPVNCSVGSFRATTGAITQADCAQCPVGQRCASGVVKAEDCGLGFYQSLLSQSTCNQCPTGHFCSLAATSVPSGCAAGSFRSAVGGVTQADCATCPVGQFCVSGVSIATDCGLGLYQQAVGQSQCEQCPAGHFCSLSATSVPTECLAGTFRAATGGSAQADCTECPAGKRCVGGSAIECGLGNYQPDTGQSVCVACPAGKYCSTTGTSVPFNCSAGSFRSTVGGAAQAECDDCPKGQYCPAGATVPVNCDVGYYQAMMGQGQCSACPKGQYCELAGTITPINCAAGSFRASDGGTTQADCSACSQGHYCVAGVSQGSNCGQGSFQSAMGQSQCEPCPAGKYCPSTTTVTPLDCAAGTFRGSTGGVTALDCVECTAGHRCADGSVAPTECGLGLFQASTGQSACDACPSGHYCSLLATSAPSSCSPGTFRALSGGSSQVDCTTCTLGTFDATTTARVSDCPLCPNGSYCLTATTAAMCPGHTDSVAGTSSQLGCRCHPGYVCAYTKRISAVVTLNATTVADFNADVNGIQTNFINSIAAAAGVPTWQITIVSVQVHGSGRRLLASDSMIDVYAKVDGARYLKNLDHHIRRELLVGHAWTEAHTVHTSAG